jgi:WD40 repeat protein
VLFAPDGKSVLAACNRTGEIRQFSVPTGQELQTLLPPKGSDFLPLLFSFSADGKFLAALGRAEHHAPVCIWDMAGARPPLLLAESSLSFGHITFAPDGKTLAMVSTDGARNPRLQLWDPTTGKPLRDLGQHPKHSQALVFSPDGKWLLSKEEGEDGKRDTVRVWDVSVGKELPALKQDYFGTLLFSPDSRTLVAGDYNALHLYEVETGKRLHKLDCTRTKGYHGPYSVPGHDQAQQGLGLPIAFSPDGQTLAAAEGTTIRRWRVASGEEIDAAANGSSIAAVAVGIAGRKVVVGSEGQVLIWDGATAKPLHRAALDPATPEASAFATSVALSPDDKLAAVGTSAGDVLLCETASGMKLWQQRGHQAAVTTLSFAVDGRSLVSAGKDHFVLWRDPATGRELGRFRSGEPKARPGPAPVSAPVFEAEETSWRSVAVSPCQRLFIEREKGIQLWELASGKRRRTIPSNESGGRSYSPGGRHLPMAVSSDSRHLAVSDSDTVRLFDLLSGREHRIFAHLSQITDVAFSPDGKLLAASGREGVRLWEVATGTIRAQLAGHRGHVTAIAFSPDGAVLATAGVDATVLLWHVSVLLEAARPAEPNARELAELWRQLADHDAVQAYQAQHRLAQHPALAVTLLRQHLQPVTAPDPARLARWLADLDSDSFQVREQAIAELEGLGELAEDALSKALAGNPSLESRRRVERLMIKLDGPVTDSSRMQALRALELLEQIGTAEAGALLAVLAKGAPGARLTREARGALDAGLWRRAIRQ